MSIAYDMRNRALAPAQHVVQEEGFRGEYLQALRLIERLHRLLLDVIKDEFDRNGGSDINSVQALLLYNIGEGELTAGELKTRGYYLGSNVSYNLKKLVDMGYIHYKRSDIAKHPEYENAPSGQRLSADRSGQRPPARAPDL